MSSIDMPWQTLVDIVHYVRLTEGNAAAHATIDGFCKELRGTEGFDEAKFIRDCKYSPSPY